MADTDLPNGFGALNRPPRPIDTLTRAGILATRRRVLMSRPMQPTTADWLRKCGPRDA